MFNVAKSFFILIFTFGIFSLANAAEIKIQVGEKRFVITDELLTTISDTKLAKALSGIFNAPKKDEEGYFLFEGNGEYFAHILSYWRLHDADIARGNVDLDVLLKEAEYWGAWDFYHFVSGVKKAHAQNRMEIPQYEFRTYTFFDTGDFQNIITKLSENYKIISIKQSMSDDDGNTTIVAVFKLLPKQRP